MLKEEFETKIKQQLQKEMKVRSIFAVPRIEKIVVNMGVGSNRENKKYIEEAIEDLAVITGQHPIKRKAKTSISNFKLRKGQIVGVSVTLRGQRMWDFYEKLVVIVFPRVRDFRGVDRKSFDGSGNFSIGFKENMVFPEIDANKVTYIKPIQVTIKTSSQDDEAGYKLLKAIGMPFKEGK